MYKHLYFNVYDMMGLYVLRAINIEIDFVIHMLYIYFSFD
jgi:hypothetical protein